MHLCCTAVHEWFEKIGNQFTQLTEVSVRSLIQMREDTHFRIQYTPNNSNLISELVSLQKCDCPYHNIPCTERYIEVHKPSVCAVHGNVSKSVCTRTHVSCVLHEATQTNLQLEVAWMMGIRVTILSYGRCEKYVSISTQTLLDNFVQSLGYFVQSSFEVLGYCVLSSSTLYEMCTT